MKKPKARNMAKKAIIIDDERLARNELRKPLSDYPEIEVVAEAANAGEGIDRIEELHPDIIFLDIQMPGKTGFDMLAELDRAPEVIFTTAYDEYALRAFEVNALDYLLKPIDLDLLRNRLARIVESRRDKEALKQAQDLTLKAIENAAHAPKPVLPQG